MRTKTRRAAGGSRKPGRKQAKQVKRTRYIYDYRPGGKTVGRQVRFKRPVKGGKPETVSQYFSYARYGSHAAAEKAAERWLKQNIQWLERRSFRPHHLKRAPMPRKRGKTGRIHLVKGPGRKRAKAA